MDSKNKLIIQKLLKIAEKQQKILEKLARVAENQQDIIHYINTGLISVVAANLELPNVKAFTKFVPPSPPMVRTDPKDPGTLSRPDPSKYFTDIFGVPANKRESFAQAIGIQLQNQKPELLGRFSYWFKE